MLSSVHGFLMFWLAVVMGWRNGKLYNAMDANYKGQTTNWYYEIKGLYKVMWVQIIKDRL